MKEINDADLIKMQRARIAFLEGEVGRLESCVDGKALNQGYDVWWHREGSGMPPRKGEEASQHVKRISRIAWRNGAYTALHPPYVPTCGDCLHGWPNGQWIHCDRGKTATRVCKSFERQRK